VVVVRGKYRDGREWANQVRECISGEIADVTAIDFLSLMDNAGLNEVDLLKIDIEGAERIVFTGDCEPWLDRVRNIAIELHDGECRSVFLLRYLNMITMFLVRVSSRYAKNLTRKKYASRGSK